MSLETEIEELQKHRDDEAKKLRFTAARTKRNFSRALNPERQIRKHLGLALGAAALAGFALAPGARKEHKAPKETEEEKPGQAKEKRPEPARGAIQVVLASLLAEAVSKVDWQALSGQLVDHFKKRFKEPGEPPMVDIANTGTARANEPIGGRFREQESSGPEI